MPSHSGLYILSSIDAVNSVVVVSAGGGRVVGENKALTSKKAR